MPEARKRRRCWRCFTRLLKSNRLYLVSDVLSPHVGAATDAAALLRFAAANGFFIAATVKARLLSGISGSSLFTASLTLREAAMLDELAAAGFNAPDANKNIGHNQARTASTRVPRVKPAQPARR